MAQSVVSERPSCSSPDLHRSRFQISAPSYGGLSPKSTSNIDFHPSGANVVPKHSLVSPPSAPSKESKRSSTCTPVRLTPTHSSTLSTPVLALQHAHATSLSSNGLNEGTGFSSEGEKLLSSLKKTSNAGIPMPGETSSGKASCSHKADEVLQSPPRVLSDDSTQVVASQPPVASDSLQETSHVDMLEHSQPAHVALHVCQTGQNDSGTNHTLTASGSISNGVQQGHDELPTFAQRDALAGRIYSVCQSAGHQEWLHLLNLAPLASQHHLSGYNCIKFGQDGKSHLRCTCHLLTAHSRLGSPYAYLPLTLQQPSQTQELIHKQKINEMKALEWLAQKRLKQVQRAKSKSLTMHTDANEELFLARQAPVNLDPRMANSSNDTQSNPETLDCKSGPLENDAVLSQEFEAPLDGTDLQESTSDALTGHQVKTSNTHPISISPIVPPELLGQISHYVQHGIPSSVRLEDGGVRYGEGHAQGLDANSLAQEHNVLQCNGRRLIRCHVTKLDLCEIAYQAERELFDASHGKRKPRLLALQDSDGGQFCHTVCQSYEHRDEDMQEAENMYAALSGAFSPEFLRNRGPKPLGDPSFVMGNLYLSSCPGKKVRLTGPARGRGAICRSLDLDLKRIKQLGVGAIICCLDDEELQFLGAPWVTYEREVDKLGLEVIRLPMTEGFCPTDVVATDEAMSFVVNEFTLRGVHVLVHCRGGVGRAGLIACTWMLKLGLVRSDRDEFVFRNEHAESHDPFVGNGTYQGFDVDQTIDRLVETIRRRRSPKAIETAEQVVFLSKVSWNYV